MPLGSRHLLLRPELRPRVRKRDRPLGSPGPVGQFLGQSADRLGGRLDQEHAGGFVDDLKIADCLHVAVVRSPHAHARIRAIETQAARAMPGVLAVLTGADVLADGVNERAAATAVTEPRSASSRSTRSRCTSM